MQFKVKILVVGPCESGKSVISNFLADATDTSTGHYRPTQGVRILESEQRLEVRGRTVQVEVELWDSSGDKKFQSCWPTLSRETNGVVFVYNPDQTGQERQLDVFYEHFVSKAGLKPASCMVFAHRRPGYDKADGILSPTFAKVPMVPTDIENEPDNIRMEFSNFLGTVVSHMSDSRDREERDIMDISGR